LAERVGYWDESPVFTVEGAIEGEHLRVVERTHGQLHREEMTRHVGRWSGLIHLAWTHSRRPSRLTVLLPVERAGKYRLSAQFTKHFEFGIIQLGLDGAKLGSPIDLYSPDTVPSGAIELGVRELSAGTHRLHIELVGANPKASGGAGMGLDYLKLDPVK
jgi:hypothetical protein